MCEREPERNRSIRQLLGAVGRAAARARECLDALSRVPPKEIDASMVAGVIREEAARRKGQEDWRITAGLLMQRFGYHSGSLSKTYPEEYENVSSALHQLMIHGALEEVTDDSGGYTVVNHDLLDLSKKSGEDLAPRTQTATVYSPSGGV